MKGGGETSVVEGVDSREQGNTQTQGESDSFLGLGPSNLPGDYTATGGRTGIEARE